MKAKISGLTLAVALAAGAAHPALAGGDVIYQGIKDPAAAIPVPAPIPIEDYAPEYYVRVDVGGTFAGSGTIDETGSNYDVLDANQIDTMEFGSIGAGRYITPSLRVELAVDLYTRGNLQEKGDATFLTTMYRTRLDGSVDTVNFDVSRKEVIKFEQDTGMVNAYWDFRNSTRFTPYIGAGFGVTYRQLSRKASESASCASLHNSADPTFNCSNNLIVPSSLTDYEKSINQWDFAAAAMAGFSYELTDDIIWDTGYRYLWQNGALTLDSPTLNGTSVLEVKDLGQHQVRTGIRLNLN